MKHQSPGLLFGLVGGGLCLLQLATLALALAFDPDLTPAAQPVLWFVALQVMAGLAILVLAQGIWSKGLDLPPDRLLLLWILALGLVLRAIAVTTPPLLEDDFYRYLWDGGVVFSGLNPYSVAPADALGDPDTSALAAQAGGLLDRINHPWLTTLYPPLAQAFFALAHWIEPWSLEAWRGLALIFDGATVALLYALLRQLGRSPLWLTLYWWNPITIQQIANVGHMDVLLLPLVLSALLFMMRGCQLRAVTCIGLAAAIKLWPLLLLPMALRPLLAAPGRLILALGLAAGFLMAIILPFWFADTVANSGLVAFSTTWAANDAAFQALVWLIERGAALASISAPAATADSIARALVAIALIGLSLGMNRRLADDDATLARRALILVAALFLTSPAQFPWYYLWLLPFLVLTPNRPLLLLTALLPLYYLRFYLEPRGLASLFDQGVVWIEYLPVWGLLALAAWQGLTKHGREKRLCAAA